MAYGIANHNGEEVDVSKLPVDLQEAIYALADDLEFKQEDPDYD